MPALWRRVHGFLKPSACADHVTQHPGGMNSHSHRELNLNVPSSFIGNGAKPESSRTPFLEWMTTPRHSPPCGPLSMEEDGCPGNDAEWEKPASHAEQFHLGSTRKWQNYRRGRNEWLPDTVEGGREGGGRDGKRQHRDPWYGTGLISTGGRGTHLHMG